VGGQPSPSFDPEVLWARSSGQRHALRAASAFHGLDPALEEVWTRVVDQAKKEGDSLGGIFEVRILGLPPGLGSYQSGLGRLTSRLGAALFSIPAIKGVEFGLGFAVGRLPGSQVHDPIVPAPPESSRRFARSSNRCGGLEGGLTTGEPLVVRAAMKPIPSLRQGMASVDLETGEAKQATYQRSDVTSVPAASVVGEAVAALALVEVFLEKYGGDSLDQVRAAFEFHAEQLRVL
jgi:chorismate synthase